MAVAPPMRANGQMPTGSIPAPAPPPTVTTTTGGLDAPVAAQSSPPAGPEPGVQAQGDERAVDDLDQFFAALRQVVHDAREQVALDESRPGAVDTPPPTRGDPGRQVAASGGEALLSRPDPGASNTSAGASVTELAPSTAELIASVEADRDLWRERAVVWRERAMGADMLIKALNAHMSDLQISLEDLRFAMRVLGDEGAVLPEPRGELTAADLTSLGRPTEREVEAGPQE